MNGKLLIVVLLVGCGTTTVVSPTETGIPDSASPDTADSAADGAEDLSIPPWDAGPPLVDGGTACGAPDGGVLVSWTCCAGKACAGECFLVDGGEVCSCFGITGGCTSPLFCCKVREGCMDNIAKCDPSK